MFTGMVTDLGSVRALKRDRDLRLEIKTAFETADVDIGASVACSGACLTVVDKGAEGDGGWLAFDVSGETLAKTTIGDWREGDGVNLERPLRVGDELSGHIVTGHVDGVGEIAAAEDEGGSRRLTVSLPGALAKFVAAKGSVALDGVSLTVNGVTADSFEVNIVPHTGRVTTFGAAGPGDRVNIEIDILARYLARMADAG